MECEFYDIEFRNLKFINCNNPIQNSYGEYYTSEELENVKMCYADIILGVIHNYVCWKCYATAAEDHKPERNL